MWSFIHRAGLGLFSMAGAGIPRQQQTESVRFKVTCAEASYKARSRFTLLKSEFDCVRIGCYSLTLSVY